MEYYFSRGRGSKKQHENMFLSYPLSTCDLSRKNSAGNDFLLLRFDNFSFIIFAQWSNFLPTTLKISPFFQNSWSQGHLARDINDNENELNLVKLKSTSQLTFTCLKSTIEAPGKGVKHVQS